MPSEPSVQVALIGIVVSFITTAGIVLVALINNKKERGGAADAGVEATLRERLTLRDEQILDLKSERDEALADLQAAKEEIEEKTLLLHSLTQELQDMRRTP